MLYVCEGNSKVRRCEVSIVMAWKINLLLYSSAFFCSVIQQVSGAQWRSVGFCHGEDTGTSIYIQYNRMRDMEHFSCHCSIRANLMDTEAYETNYYYIYSGDIKGPSKRKGGYFTLSFTSGNTRVIVSNETKTEDERIFETLATQDTDISLMLYPDMKTPKVLEIDIYGDLLKIPLNVNCRSGYRDNTTAGVNIAAIAGGVVGCGVVFVGIAAVIVICRMKRNKHTGDACEPKESHASPLYAVPEMDSIYSVADDRENNNALSKGADKKPTYFQLEPTNKTPGYINAAVSASRGYDHLTFQQASVTAPSQQSSHVYDHVTDKTDDCYNHTGVEHKNVNVDYDTTASASKAVNELGNKDDDYSYDHLGVSTKTTVTDSDYDTTQPR